MKRLLTLILLTGCTAAPQPATTATTAPVEQAAPRVAGDAILAELEQRLLGIDRLDIRYYTESTGPADTFSRGSMTWRGDAIRIDANGTINGEIKSRRYEPSPAPADLKRAIVLGWTRMGIMHNLYRLMTEQNVQNETGGIEEFVRAENVTWDETARDLRFDILVQGKRVGTARLWLMPNGLPSHREQTVHFPNGDMKVVERYQWLPS